MVSAVKRIWLLQPWRLHRFISVILTSSSRDPGAFTQVSVHMDHQMGLVRRHLEIAAEFGRPVSMHTVRAYGHLQVRGRFGHAPRALASFEEEMKRLRLCMWRGVHEGHAPANRVPDLAPCTANCCFWRGLSMHPYKHDPRARLW